MKLIGSDAGPFEHRSGRECRDRSGSGHRDVQFGRPGRFVLATACEARPLLQPFFLRDGHAGDRRGAVARRGAGEPSGGAIRDGPHRRRGYLGHRRYRRLLQRDRPITTLELTMGVPRAAVRDADAHAVDSSYFAPAEWSGTMPGMNWRRRPARSDGCCATPTPGVRTWTSAGASHAAPSSTAAGQPAARIPRHAAPDHIHGQRFLVIAVNGFPSRNRRGRTRVLVPAGGSVDILLDLSNPGRWMLHCHVAEHLAAQMMTEFTVQ